MESNKPTINDFVKKNSPEYVLSSEAKRIRETLDSLNDNLSNIDFEYIDVVKGEPGEKGEDGKTPIKGVDYFTEDEIGEFAETIRSFVTDGKDGINGKDGKDGKTPVKGVDYFTEKDVRSVTNKTVEFINSTSGVIKPKAVEGLEDLMNRKIEDIDFSKMKNAPQLKFDPNKQPYYQVSASGGGGTPFVSPLTTKGDLFTYDTANARLGVGADGQILIADSTQATGLRWGSEVWQQITEWSPTTPVEANQIQTQDGRLIQRIAAGTTGATFDATEAGLYTLLNLGTAKDYVGGKYYFADEQVIIGTRTLKRTTGGVSNGAFTNAEAALYTLISNPVPSVWVSTNYEYQGELFTVGTRLVIRTAVDGISGLTFDATESSNYELIKPLEVTSFQANTLYYKGEELVDEGVIYRRFTTGETGVSFNAAEQVFWRVDGSDNLPIGATSQTKTAATYTVSPSDGEVILAPAGATQVITFDEVATPQGKEFGFNGTVDSTKLITWTTAGGLTIEDPVSHLPVASFDNSTWIDNAEFSFQVIRAGNILRLRGI